MGFVRWWAVRMARRRTVELPAGAEPFDRSPAQWRELGAPEFVADLAVAAEFYSRWALPGYGRGLTATDPTARRYYVAMAWLPRCVRPLYLAHVRALLPGEVQLLSGDRRNRWGRLGRCWSPMLAADADVPAWLECCRREDRRGSA
jgi:hypothetical protein